MEVFDEYCERVGPGLFEEPINALSNFSFIIAAWAAWRLARHTGTLSTGVKVLIGLAGSVGIGSMLWHTFANTLGLYLDVVPIAIFIMLFIWLYTRNVMGKGVGFAVLSVAAFPLATFLVSPVSEALHGAPAYSPGLLVVLVLGGYHALEEKPSRFTLLAAGGVYFVALFFRTIDLELCHFMTIGTHFIWHTLIGLVTYLAMRSLILSLASRVVQDRPAEREPMS